MWPFTLLDLGYVTLLGIYVELILVQYMDEIIPYSCCIKGHNLRKSAV